jgi:hypothetical protein
MTATLILVPTLEDALREACRLARQHYITKDASVHVTRTEDGAVAVKVVPR